MVLEVMGRDAGHIALNAGIAGGADVILIPEIQYPLDKIRDKIDSVKREQNRNFSLVVVAEGVMNEAGELLTITGGIRFGGIGHHLGKRITEETGAQTGVTVFVMPSAVARRHRRTGSLRRPLAFTPWIWWPRGNSTEWLPGQIAIVSMFPWRMSWTSPTPWIPMGRLSASPVALASA